MLVWKNCFCCFVVGIILFSKMLRCCFQTLRPTPLPSSSLPSSLFRYSTTTPPTSPRMHVVLVQPSIPQNAGGIGRTCLGLDASLVCCLFLFVFVFYLFCLFVVLLTQLYFSKNLTILPKKRKHNQKKTKTKTKTTTTTTK